MYSSRAYFVDRKLSIIIAIFALSFVITTTNGKSYQYCAETKHKPFINANTYETEDGWQKWEKEYSFQEYILLNHKQQKAEGITYPKNLEEKYTLFKDNFTVTPHENSGTVEYFPFQVERWNILEDSYNGFPNEEAIENFKKPLDFNFVNESESHNISEGRTFATEWFWLLSTEISKKYFLIYVDDKQNHQVEINPEIKNLKRFEFIGRVIGAAIYHQKPINMDFIKPYYEIMLSKGLIDETQDEQLILVENQMCALLKGIADFISLPYLRIFTSDELQTVIGGEKVTDDKVWESIISDDNETFKNVVNEFTNNEREQLLQFLTGSSRIPLSRPAFKLEVNSKAEVKKDEMPEVDLADNSIILSNDWEAQEMKDKIKKAMQNGLYREPKANVESSNSDTDED